MNYENLDKLVMNNPYIITIQFLAILYVSKKLIYKILQMVYDTVDGDILKGMGSTKLRGFSCGTVFLIFTGVFLALAAVMIGNNHNHRYTP